MRDDAFERLSVMLDNLSTQLGVMKDRQKDFVEQTIERFANYGKTTRLSDKQWNWLEDLHREYCPNAPELPKLDDLGPEDFGLPGPTGVPF